MRILMPSSTELSKPRSEWQSVSEQLCVVITGRGTAWLKPNRTGNHRFIPVVISWARPVLRE